MDETSTDLIDTPATHANGADALVEKPPAPLVQVNFGEDGWLSEAFVSAVADLQRFAGEGVAS